MASTSTIPTRDGATRLPTLLSLFLPGAGQYVLGRRARAVSILLATLALGYLIPWGLDNYRIGEVTLAGVRTSWLFIPFVLFWAWNVSDADRQARGKRGLDAAGILLLALVIYTIAWQVTDVRLDRLVTRFNNALKIGNDLIHPDLFTRNAAGRWVPSENFGYIFGSIVQKPAPDILVRLRLVQAGGTLPTFQAGKIIETIAIGFMATLFSTILAVPFSFLAARNIMSRVPGGTAIYYATRTFLNTVRAVDTLIWGLIVVLWVGLGPFAGVIALTIHSVAALGKLFSEEVEHVDPGPIEAVTATGAELTQTIRYAVIPQVVPSFLAYTLLRWDINMRAATVVGFVAGGGIGYFVVETIRKSGYTQYAAALWAVAVVVVIVDYVSAKWRERIMVGETSDTTAAAPRPFYKSLRVWFYIILGAAVFAYFWQLAGIDPRLLFDPAPTLGRFVRGFLSFNLTPVVVNTVLREMLVTIFQALLATTLGALLAIPFSFLAARNLTGRSRLSMGLYYVTRGMFNLLRSIEALLYVAIFFYWVSFGNFAGMLALMVTTFGLVGKLFSEAIENIDPGPLEAVTATGATRLQAIVYGVVPQIIPPFVAYGIYQWDINVRMATIVGFAGGGGIGNLLYNDYFPFSKYRSAGTAVAVIVIVVALMDFVSAKVREKLV
jgi:phosphonate transport system permease protein